MKYRSLTAAAFLSLAVVTACGDGDLAGLNTDCSNLLGTFRATSFTASSVSGGRSANLLANGGQFDITFADQVYSSNYAATTGGTPTRSGGTSSYSQGGITFPTVMFPGGPGNQQFACEVDDDTLTLRASGSTYRFEGQPQAEPANFSITLNRIGE